MTILITGNDPRVIQALSVLLCENNKVIVASRTAKENLHDRRVVPFCLTPSDQMFNKIFSSFEFSTVIYVTSRHLRAEIEQKGELDDLKHVLELSVKEKVGQVICISSTTVYWGNDQVEEDSLPLPTGTAGHLLSAGEQLCRFYKDKFGLNTVVLHVPYLYGNEGCDLIDSEFILQCMDGKIVCLPGSLKDICDFLCEADLADLLLRMIDDPYSLESGVINVASGYALTFSDLACHLKNYFPQMKFEFARESNEHPVSVEVETARKYYDWIAVNCFPKDFPMIMDRYIALLPERKSLKKSLASFFESPGIFMRILELLLGFFLMEILNSITQTSAQFRFIDFRLLFVVVMGVTHGIRSGVIAAVLASLSYMAGYLKTEAGWEVLFYNIDNWLPMASYLIAGAVTGNSRDKSMDRELILKNQQKSLEERYVFLYELYDQTLENKNLFKNQLISYRDSFGRIYDAISKLDSMEYEEIFMKATHVLEDVLNSKSIAMYTVDSGMNYARLLANSEGLDIQLSSSLSMAEHAHLREVLLKEGIWCNKNLEEDEPAYCALLRENEKAVAIIALWNAKYEQMTTAYLNLFKVLSQLVEASLVRAIAYRASKEKNLYLPRTHIMVSQEFNKQLKIKQQMRDNNISKFKLVRVETRVEEPVWLSQAINSCIRNTDVLGQMNNGKYYILLSQADDKNIGLVMRRLSERGIMCSVEEVC